ncbi:hypothetical protein UPYG_G00299540 [Umbra pygmaea]|uniref:Immunoglobulin domain-containing protein n=1 Tax=Umbra pygmaea TaxID=75934 RepID=A0ABD0WPP3_UMBPY
MFSPLVLTLVSLFFASMSVSVTQGIKTVVGYVGQDAVIQCSYDEKRRSDQKYLCKGGCPLHINGKVIETEAGTDFASNEKYSLTDNRIELNFIVKIHKLELNDAGQYWCGVNIYGVDDYVEVNLTVEKGKTVVPKTSVATVVSVSLVILVLLLVISLIIVYRWKKKKETAVSTKPIIPHNGINKVGSHGDGCYEETKEHLTQSGSDATPVTNIYANLPTIPSDSLNYSSVNFLNDPTCSNEAGVVTAKIGYSSYYSPVNFGQTPT